MNEPTISVVIASLNARHSIAGCLRALETERPTTPLEIIVVDSSMDGTDRIIEQSFPQVTLIKIPPPVLVPELWGIGIAHANGDVIAITTAHCVPDEHWLAEIKRAHRSAYPAVGGAIEQATPARVVDWAVYFCRFSSFMRAFIRGMHRYGTDKEFSKRVLAKYASISDEQLLEATWNEVAPTLLKVPRPSPKGMQFLIEGLFKDKTPLPKPESFVDNTLVDELERSGFIDSVYK